MSRSPRNPSHFARGSGVYQCRCCKRNTRSTGRGDNENVELCAECYDLAGNENSLSDTGELYDNPENILNWIAAIELKGGSTALWQDLRKAAWDAIGQQA